MTTHDGSGGSAADIDESFVARPRADAVFVELDGELVVTAPLEGDDGEQFDAHWLDARATLVWNCLDGRTTLREVVDDITEGFGVDRDVVAADVVDLARSLGRSGLLEGIRAEPPEPPEPVALMGAPVGSPLPPFRLGDLDGGERSDADFRDRQVLFVNWNPACEFCAEMAPELASLVAPLSANGCDLVLVASGPAEENRELLRRSGLTATVLINGGFELFDGLGTPVAYLVDGAGRVASRLALGVPEVMSVAGRAAGRAAGHHGHP